jgi:hypothetical protein
MSAAGIDTFLHVGPGMTADSGPQGGRGAEVRVSRIDDIRPLTPSLRWTNTEETTMRTPR